MASLLLLVSSCGTETIDTPEPSAPLIDLCVATVEETTLVTDFFGDYEFTINAGDGFPILSIISSVNLYDLVRTTSSGSFKFELNANDLTLSNSCEGKQVKSVCYVFEDVTVYEDNQLTTPLCDLAAGEHADLVGSGFYSISNEVLYMSIGEFAERCGGATAGYMSAPSFGNMGSYRPMFKVLAEANEG